MRPVLTPDEAGALDRASEERGVSTGSLMEAAGRAVASAAAGICGGSYGRRAVVVCGKGNNGGDGLVAARYLARWGMSVAVVCIEEPAAGLPADNLARLDEVPAARVVPVGSLERELERSDVAVDAIFGTGFRGEPGEPHSGAILALNSSSVPVIAADIPSGVDGATGAVGAVAVDALLTITFGAAKPGVVLFPGADHAGLVEVVDIGFPPDLVTSRTWLLEAADVDLMLPERASDTHKRAAGFVLVIGGSRVMTGAPALAARAAYRAGAGLVTVAVPASILPVVQAAVPEATFLPLPETADGTVAAEASDVLSELVDAVGAIAVGPGMTTHPETADFVRRLVASAPHGLVVDADGLNALASDHGSLAGARGADTVLTPHAGEFARLSDVPPGQDRISDARALAERTGATIVYKGSRSIIAEPGGEVRINPTGSSALATGGTGDVLTGAIAALMARGLRGFDAASAGAYLHGLAGLAAARDKGEGLTALDVAEALPLAAMEVRS